MQTSKPYNRGHADALLEPCGEVSPWRIDDRGVWPAYSDYEEAKRLGLESEQKLLSWKPVMVFQDDQNAPDCKDTPALPFPFDARDLAAFMLDGVGAFVADYYGDWEDGPETESLNDIDPGNNYARRAVREAFDAYREAKRAIGCPDGESPDTDAMARELLKPTPPEQPQAAAPVPVAQVVAELTQEQRQAKRWQMCIDAGLAMPTDTFAHLPRGVGKVAKELRITRQALQQDLNAHRERLFGK